MQGRSLADSESLRASQSQGQCPISQSGGGLEPYDSFRVQCFASNLGFREIQVQVDVQTSDVMAGAGGAARDPPRTSDTSQDVANVCLLIIYLVLSIPITDEFTLVA